MTETLNLETVLDSLEREGYHDVRLIALPQGARYNPGRTPHMVWVCEVDPYPGDPEPLYAWGATRLEAAEALYKLIVKLHPDA